MSQIDVQNAKQIRDPMDVLITLELPDESVTLSFSGYSGAKVADGKLNNPTWPMRKLADLQDNGFPLNGEHVLYNPNTSASLANGKLGVRGNVGETVTITVTGNKTITALTIFASGAESVSYNGATTNIIANQAIIPVGARSITLTFNPVGEDERIEVSEIQPGTIFRITNENLIKAIVSLRSDLSLFDQSLPESEMNVEIYSDTDISEIVASIPNDTPVTYSAGYPGDMSEERKFYVSDQVTWADNVLSIKAVDAVHFLDTFTAVPPVLFMNPQYFFWDYIYGALEMAGVNLQRKIWRMYGTGCDAVIKEEQNLRTLIAFLNQCLNLTDDDGRLLDGSWVAEDVIQFSYVDAGIPTLSTDRYIRRKEWRISEDDCADVIKYVEKPTSEVTTIYEPVQDTFAGSGSRVEDGAIKVGTATWTKNVGTSLQFDEYTSDWAIGLFLGFDDNNEIAKKLGTKYGNFMRWMHVFPAVPADTWGTQTAVQASTKIGETLLYGTIPQEWFKDVRYNAYSYSSFVPWSQRYDYDITVEGRNITTQSQMWKALVDAKIIDSASTNIDLDIYGHAYLKKESRSVRYTRGSGGQKYEYSELPFLGNIECWDQNINDQEIFPSKMLASPMYRSNKTGAFKWKGDPRMQPRDVIEFERLDGTVQEITLENITITHEGGGTYADYTYREGVI